MYISLGTVIMFIFVAIVLIPNLRKTVNTVCETMDDSVKTGATSILIDNKKQRQALHSKNKELGTVISADDLLNEILNRK